MKANILTPEKYSVAVTEVARILTEDATTWAAENPVHVSFGPLGVLSPLSRAAFVHDFGEDTTARIEADARATLCAKADRYHATLYHAHTIEANDAHGVPSEGSYFWAYNSGLKAESGLHGEIDNMVFCDFDREELQHARHKVRTTEGPTDATNERPARLCYCARLFTVTPEQLDDVRLADYMVKTNALQGGSRSDDIPDDADMVKIYNDDEALATFYTVGAVVTDGTRWYFIDSEGYDYARYVYLPTSWRTMFADIYDAKNGKRLARIEAERLEAEAARAARLEDYKTKCAKWSPYMVDLRPLQAEVAQAQKADDVYRRGSAARKTLQAAERRLSNALRKNILTMCEKAFPGVKFYCRKDDCHDYGVSWYDGPTTAEFDEATNLELFTRVFVGFDGYSDCTTYDHAEFTEFADKYAGIAYGSVGRDRLASEDCRKCIAQAIREVLPLSDDNDPVVTAEDVCKFIDAVKDTDPHLCDIHVSYCGWLSGLVHQCWALTSFYTRPEGAQIPPTVPAVTEPETTTDNDDEVAARHLSYTESDGLLIIIADTPRGTYKYRREIKAHGAVWNKGDQRWQTTDATTIEAIKAWLH